METTSLLAWTTTANSAAHLIYIRTLYLVVIWIRRGLVLQHLESAIAVFRKQGQRKPVCSTAFMTMEILNSLRIPSWKSSSTAR